MNRGNRDFGRSNFGRGGFSRPPSYNNSSYNTFSSRRDNHGPRMTNPGFNTRSENAPIGSSALPLNLTSFGGSSNQIELAGQLISALLSSTNAGSHDRSRTRERSPPYRSRSPSYRRDRSYSRRSRSRSPRPRSFDRRVDHRRGRYPGARGRFPRPRGSFRREGKPHSEFPKKRANSESNDIESHKKLSGHDTRSPEKTECEKSSKSPDKEQMETSSPLKDKFPSENLFCHICNHGGFTSEETYLYHLEGVRHGKTAVAFHQKNSITLEYLRHNAQLACIRVGRLDRSIRPYKCTTCDAVVRERFQNHKRLIEHKLVKKFMMPKCCGRIFKNHHEMDEHRLSLPHLRKVQISNEQKGTLLEQLEESWGAEDITSTDTDLKPLDVLVTLKSRMNQPFQEIKKPELMPPFDGNSIIGLEYLKPKPSMACEPCQILIPSSLNALETHLLSITHYNALTEFLRNKKREEMKNAKENESKENVKDAHSDDESDEDLMYDESQHIILEEVGEQMEDSDQSDSEFIGTAKTEPTEDEQPVKKEEIEEE